MNNLFKVFVALFFVLPTGCASVGIVSPVSSDIKGRIQDNVYTSPGDSFRIHMPQLLKPGAKVHDQIPKPNALWVSFSDDLCREFIVVEYPGEIGDLSIDEWVDSTVIPGLLQANAVMLERKTVQTRYGQGVFIRYRQPAAAPCVIMKFSGGKQINEKPDAEIGVYNLHVGGYFYRIMYVVGDDSDLASFGIKIRPLNQLLDQFVKGLEILRAEPK